MLSGVGSDRVEGDPIPIVEFGIVRRKGTHYARVGGSHCQHLVDLSAHAVVAAHAASGLQMKLIAWRQLHRLQGLVDKVAGRLGHGQALSPRSGTYGLFRDSPPHGCRGSGKFGVTQHSIAQQKRAESMPRAEGGIGVRTVGGGLPGLAKRH